MTGVWPEDGRSCLPSMVSAFKSLWLSPQATTNNSQTRSYMSTQQTSQPSAPVAAVTLPSIALLGGAGSGKDTAADLIRGAYPQYKRIAFADKLKRVAQDIWGLEAQSNREYLQRLGVAVREIDPDAWVNAALRNTYSAGTHPQVNENSEYPQFGPFVFTDVRFPNEVRALVARGFITIRILADRGTRLNRLAAIGKLTTEEQLTHISETALDGYASDHTVLNDDTLETFGQRLFTIVERERQRRG